MKKKIIAEAPRATDGDVIKRFKKFCEDEIEEDARKEESLTFPPWQDGLWIKLNRIERMLKFLICRMPYVTFNDVRIEDAPDISDIMKEKK